jgi:large subunit ribosomal protein L1
VVFKDSFWIFNKKWIKNIFFIKDKSINELIEIYINLIKRIIILLFPALLHLCRRDLMDKESLDKFNAFIEENKGKRKFNQSVELAINFMGIDMSKQDNRLNLEIKLPNPKGKSHDVIVFADDKSIAERAKASGAKIIPSSEIAAISSDKIKLNELLNGELLAQPSLMPQIAKALGQVLGPRNKMPRPLIGTDINKAVEDTARSVYIRSKGKYLPTVHCMVATESMDIGAIAANIDEVVASVTKRIGRDHIKSVYAKLTMSKPIRII